MTDRDDLKIAAFKESVGRLTSDYEERIAELRVQLTLASRERDEVKRQLQELRDKYEQNETE
jgi:uncharacterized protein YeeX (DUF496 family)